MRRLNGILVGVDSGFVRLVDHWAEASPIWSGDGARTVRVPVAFSEMFDEAPAVTLSLSVLDADAATFLRMNLRPMAVTRKGFEAVLDTWGDTRLARVGANWQAIGTVPDPDEVWDI